MDFDAALKTGEKYDPQLRYIHGRFLIDTGKVTEGIAELRNAADLGRDDVVYYADLAEALVASEKYDDVSKVVKQVAELTENDTEKEAYLNFAYLFETAALACTNCPYDDQMSKFYSSLGTAKIKWSFEELDKWLTQTHCASKAKEVVRQMIEARRKLIDQ